MRDCSPFPPGLRRESRDEQQWHDMSDRPLAKTAGNALHEAADAPPAPPLSPVNNQRVSGKVSFTLREEKKNGTTYILS